MNPRQGATPRNSSFMRSALLAGLGLGFAAGALALAGAPASAGGGGGGRYYEESYHFKKMMRGYSGPAGRYWCDYKNLPDITCTQDKYGNERCKRTGWILRQHCY